MTIPTGQGLTLGREAADQPGGTTFNRAAYAARNNSMYNKQDQQPDPCICGCCNMTRKAI